MDVDLHPGGTHHKCEEQAPSIAGNGLVLVIDDHAAAVARIPELVASHTQVLRLLRTGKKQVRRYKLDVVAPLWTDLYCPAAGLATLASAQVPTQLSVGRSKACETP